MSLTERKVTRVLVMLEYGPGDPDNGEVFDLTELAKESATKCENGLIHARIELQVHAGPDYSAKQPWPIVTDAKWIACVNFKNSAASGHLDDAINSALPDSLTTENLRKKADRLQKRRDQLNSDIQIQRLRDAAAIRHQHPIARVTCSPLPEVAQATLAEGAQ